ncbi:MAG: HesA/MoeB/ThiF family protein [Cuniculiplasma sp.]
MKNSFEQTSVSIVGMGGNGQLASMILSAYDVNLTIIDGDTVEENNIRRQPLFTRNDVGRKKSEVVFEKIMNRNSPTKVNYMDEYVDSANIGRILKDSKFIFDATDSFLTRELINEYACKENIPWIMTNSYGDFGEVKLTVPGITSCLNCLTNGKNMIPLNCHLENVSPPVPSVISGLGLKLFLDFKENGKLNGDMYFFDFSQYSITRIGANRARNCRVCVDGIYEKINDEKIIGRQLY